jgi:AcrR family transcriptional regulator
VAPQPRHQAEHPARRRLQKSERREQLLAAAEAVFVERGYGATTFDDIAAAAGVTRPLLYVHFSAVDEVYLACHRAAREEMQQWLFAATAAAPENPRDQLRAGLSAYFRFVRERPDRFALLYGPGAAGGPLAAAASELRFATAEQISALFIAADPQVPRLDAIAHAHIVSGGAEQLAKWWQRNPDVPLETVVERIVVVFWDGLNEIHVRARA